VEKRGYHICRTSKIGICIPLNCTYLLPVLVRLRNNRLRDDWRPDYWAACKSQWQSVKNCMQSHMRTDEIHPKTGVCTSLKSEFSFADNRAQSQYSLTLNLCEFLWRSVEKHGNRNHETAKIEICTPLKLNIYFRFVSQAIDIEPTISQTQSLIKIGENRKGTVDLIVWQPICSQTHTHGRKWLDSLSNALHRQWLWCVYLERLLLLLLERRD